MGMRLMSELLDEGADVLVGNDTMVLILASCVCILAGGIHKAVVLSELNVSCSVIGEVEAPQTFDYGIYYRTAADTVSERGREAGPTDERPFTQAWWWLPQASGILRHQSGQSCDVVRNCAATMDDGTTWKASNFSRSPRLVATSTFSAATRNTCKQLAQSFVPNSERPIIASQQARNIMALSHVRFFLGYKLFS
jgi:hypothetical protein